MGMFYGHNQGLSESLGYGYLYNRYAANDVNFAPTDWKIPTDAELSTLEVSSNIIDPGNAAGALRETTLTHWDSPNLNASNLTLFTAWGSGYRYTDGLFYSLKQFFLIHSTTGSRVLSYNTSTFPPSITDLTAGMSVRLLYTGVGTPTTVTDNDGNVYDVVKIGSQYWTVQNWKCTTLDNGDPIPNVTNSTTWGGLSTLARCAYDNDENNV